MQRQAGSDATGEPEGVLEAMDPDEFKYCYLFAIERAAHDLLPFKKMAHTVFGQWSAEEHDKYGRRLSKHKFPQGPDRTLTFGALILAKSDLRNNHYDMFKRIAAA